MDAADAVILDFGSMKMDFDMWGFVSTLGMFLKQPVIIRSKNRALAQAFLRCYAGRAGITEDSVMPEETYGALHVQSCLE